MTTEPPTSLLGLLQRTLPSPSAMQESLSAACLDLGLEESDTLSPACVAYVLLKHSTQPEEVSRLLSWREFEQLAAALLRVGGFVVKENLTLTKPRAQIDAVAFGTSMILCIDCKHYRREPGPASLRKFATAQLRRSGFLRKKIDDPRPIASVILSVSEPEGSFVQGVAVVPVRTLRNFLTSLDSYSELFELR
ncbi:MAG TPA: restriction endonuclease [Nitrososphaerales archaeon]|nr:restriction endonuclease [Nitrososphaerales archaeon]